MSKSQDNWSLDALFISHSVMWELQEEVKAWRRKFRDYKYDKKLGQVVKLNKESGHDAKSRQ